MRMIAHLPAVILFACSTLVLGQSSGTLTLHHSSPNTVDVMMTNSLPVAGFQFDVTGPTILQVDGGSSLAAALQVPFNPANGRVLGFSFSLNTIPVATTPTLLTRIILDLNGPQVGTCPTPGCPPLQAGLTGIVLSDVTGTVIPANTSASLYPAEITLGATPGPGVALPLQLFSPNDAGAPYVCGLTLNPSPGFTLPAPDSRVIPLSNDFLLSLALTPGNPYFLNFSGLLSPATGSATVTLIVPNIPTLAGFTLYAAYVTVSPYSSSGIGSISQAITITL